MKTDCATPYSIEITNRLDNIFKGQETMKSENKNSMSSPKKDIFNKIG